MSTADELARNQLAAELAEEVTRRNEYYGLDNWPFREVVDWVLDHAKPYYGTMEPK